jgi:RDD family
MAAPLDRRALGSWLDGPRAAAQADGVVFPPRGERLGLPADGPGSVAPVGRRVLALAVDWLAASVVVLATGTRTSDRAYGWLVLAVFAVLTTALLATTGRSLGHAALGLQLRETSPRRLRSLRVVLRQVLLCLVVPACIWDSDGRGMHDKAAGTVLVRS